MPSGFYLGFFLPKKHVEHGLFEILTHLEEDTILANRLFGNAILPSTIWNNIWEFGNHQFPDDSSRDLLIPDRWRSLNLWRGHLIIPKRAQRIARLRICMLFLKFDYILLVVGQMFRSDGDSTHVPHWKTPPILETELSINCSIAKLCFIFESKGTGIWSLLYWITGV